MHQDRFCPRSVSQNRCRPRSVSQKTVCTIRLSMLRSICAASLLGICEFMVPAESAVIPHFDSIMLHMKSYDSPSDGKSSFQVELSEIRSIVTRAISRSLVLIDEICRGTETAKGSCIVGSIIETLDSINCMGIVSTHLHGIFDLPLRTKNAVFKAMGPELIDNQTMPTWKLMDRICRESLAFETAKREGVPEELIRRAKQMYVAVYEERSDESKSKEHSSGVRLVGPAGTLHEEVKAVVVSICREKVTDLCEKMGCVLIGVREQPTPSKIGASSIYVMLRPDGKLYVGKTDDLQGRVRAHRSKEGMQNASFIYFLVGGKSTACQLETLLINQLPNKNFRLSNFGDGKHRNFGILLWIGSKRCSDAHDTLLCERECISSINMWVYKRSQRWIMCFHEKQNSTLCERGLMTSLLMVNVRGIEDNFGEKIQAIMTSMLHFIGSFRNL